MGEVWRARDTVLDRDVAVKLLRDVHDPTMAERFRRESLSTARVVHDDVVKIFDAGSDDNDVFLVMELLPGPTLAEPLQQRGAMPVEMAVEYARQVSAALGTAAPTAGGDDWTHALRDWAEQALARGEADIHARAREALDHTLMQAALRAHDNHRQHAAAALGVGRNTLTRKLGASRTRRPNKA